MRTSSRLSMASPVRAKKRLSALSSRMLALGIVCAFGLLSTVFLQTAPVAHAASNQVASNSTIKLIPVEVYTNHTKLHDLNSCRSYPSTDCNVAEFINAGKYQAFCQQAGQSITDTSVYSEPNNWWTLLLKVDGDKAGWVSNLYITGDSKITGIDGETVPDCNQL